MRCRLTDGLGGWFGPVVQVGRPSGPSKWVVPLGCPVVSIGRWIEGVSQVGIVCMREACAFQDAADDRGVESAAKQESLLTGALCQVGGCSTEAPAPDVQGAVELCGSSLLQCVRHQIRVQRTRLQHLFQTPGSEARGFGLHQGLGSALVAQQAVKLQLVQHPVKLDLEQLLLPGLVQVVVRIQRT
jgi:hypothetical protein